MSKKDEMNIDIKTRARQMVDGTRGFGNANKLRKLGMEAYCAELEGKLAEKLVRAQNDKRRQKGQ